MDALRASYGGDASSDSDSHLDATAPPPQTTVSAANTSTPSQPPSAGAAVPLPPPPLSLLDPPNSIGEGTLLISTNQLPDFRVNVSELIADLGIAGKASRIRSFPHVDGNYALHVYIPVFIPLAAKKELGHYLKKVTSLVPGLHVVDVDLPLSVLCRDNQKLEQVALGREFHISLGRTVPIRVHQIGSVVAMLRQKLQLQKRYWVDFNKWEIFVNDDHSRTFLSVEVTSGGLPELKNQIQVVNGVYKLHNLPEFYKDPRPHISLAWALGDISDTMKRVVTEETKRLNFGLRKRLFTVKFSGIQCKIGCKTHQICKFPDE